MPSPLVQTKLYVPKVRRGVVPRPRLRDRLSRTPHPRLTLISAPPGFGKTTLLAAWLDDAAAAVGRPVAWVSLEESERQPTSFWTYVLTALGAAAPGVGAGSLPLLQTADPSIATVLATVLNELSALPDGLDLVLDDYHLADGPGISIDVAFLVEHLPPPVRLVISTRADPALPLARLRARGELVEVRAADLRFTLDEVAAYLNDVTELDLQAADIAALESRTEGWIAALQLAALSLQGREDRAGFIAGFAGDDRYVVDYLVEEVLARQRDAVSFLLQTSILDRLSGPLCDAVTLGEDGKALLESLDRSNMFLVPLDDSRHWYRYHHLFADVLRTHLVKERPGDVTDLHRRAGQWYGAAGEPVAAVRHTLAAGDVARAADLVELAMPALRRDRQETTIRRWLDDIPDEVVRVRPVLAMGFIGALMAAGQFDGLERRLDDVQRLLDVADGEGSAAPSLEMVVVDAGELPRLPGAIAAFRAALALVGGDLAATVVHAERAIVRGAEGDHVTRAAASALSGLASWASGDLAAAHRGYSAAVDGLRRAAHLSDVLGCSITLADIRITQGRLGDARRTYEDGLELAANQDGGTVMRGTADMLVGLSQIAVERNDLAAATAHLTRVEELGEQAGLPQHPYRWRVARARLREAQGDVAGAVALLEEAERVYVSDFSPNVRPVPALRARLLLEQGGLAEALEWARHHDLSADDDLSYVRELEHLTLARILLHQHTAARSEAAVGRAYALLERLRVAAEAGGRAGSVIEILTVQAMAHYVAHRPGDVTGALALLERALRLAEPEGYVRVFVDEGPMMTPLLDTLIRAHPSWSYPRRLLDVFDGVGGAAGVPSADAQARPVSPAFVDPLSGRELDVLRLLATDLDGPAIARELVVSLNTVRTHTKSIYAKLGVNSRRAAVSQARRFDLLSPTRPR